MGESSRRERNMDKSEMLARLKKKLSVDEEQAELILNEMLAIKVVPNFFRKSAVERLALVTNMQDSKAELAVNEFVGTITSRPAIFEEVIGSFTQAAVTNGCDQCRDCFNCGKEAFQVLAQLG